MEYLIRFQNTGTDTAFTVVIEDKISPVLDLTSLEAGASSHAYRLGVNANRTLSFTFDNIMLPDSNVNEVASHGFVKFKIKQNRDLPVGTVIYNRAGIFFDFNEAVITNQTFHTVTEPLITVAVGEVILPHVNIIAYPNPFEEQTTIAVEGFLGKDLQLELYDINGYLLSTQKAENNQFVLSRKQLGQGMYFYRILGEEGLVGVGKLIAH